MWTLYHTVVTRALLVVLVVVGSLGIGIVWLIRQPVHLLANVSDWLDDQLIDLEESIYERAWVARSRLPAWKDK